MRLLLVRWVGQSQEFAGHPAGGSQEGKILIPPEPALQMLTLLPELGKFPVGLGEPLDFLQESFVGAGDSLRGCNEHLTVELGQTGRD